MAISAISRSRPRNSCLRVRQQKGTQTPTECGDRTHFPNVSTGCVAQSPRRRPSTPRCPFASRTLPSLPSFFSRLFTSKPALELGAHDARLRSHVQAGGRSSEFAGERCAALLTALVSGQCGCASCVPVSKPLAREPSRRRLNRHSTGLEAGERRCLPPAAGNEALPSLGGWQPTHATAGDQRERARSLTMSR